MDPYNFELLVGDIWEKKEYKTNVRAESRDRGIDVEARKPGELLLIQAKRYGRNNKIGSQKIREYATLYQQVGKATNVIIISSGYFTDEGKILANDLSVDLINGDELFRIINNTCPEIAVGYLHDVSSAEGNTQSDNPFLDPNKFSRTGPYQAYFDGCREPRCDGRVWYGKQPDKIHLKCEKCHQTWVGKIVAVGLLEKIFGKGHNVANWEKVEK